MVPAKPIVAIDLETTGFSSHEDAILEIGAVRFRGDRIEEEWNTLVNPGRPIPGEITQLTGITDAMVGNSPRIDRCIEPFRSFVGDCAVLGHSVGFDLGFLQRWKLFENNDALDTFDLASVLLPRAPRYSLGALALSLGVLLPVTHRALDDARATHSVFLRLVQRAQELPIDLLAELVRLGEGVEWGGGAVLEELLGERLRREGAIAKKSPSGPTPFLGPLEEASGPPLKPRAEPLALDRDEIIAVLDEGGPLASRFPAYERRSQQLEMVAAVADAFSESRHLLVEAGTGTGKTLAYLVPAAYWATRNGRRVVISTNTINLQDQLIHKDIPDLRQALGLPLRAAVLKGRANYLCPRKLELYRHRGPETREEMRVLGKTLVWLRETQSGDRSELNLSGPAERQVWDRLSAEDEQCTLETCESLGRGACPFLRARKGAETAHLVIINHSLLIADIAMESRLLPEYDYLVVDEAHHLESAATEGLAFHLSQAELDRNLRDLGNARRGLLAGLLVSKKLPPETRDRLRETVGDLSKENEQAILDSQRFFEALRGFVETVETPSRPEYALQVRLQPSTRTQPGWDEIEISWDNLHEQLLGLSRGAHQLSEAILEEGGSEEETQEAALAVAAWARRTAEMGDQTSGVISGDSPNLIYWVDVDRERGTASLHAAPLRVGPLIERYLWHEKSSIVMTSATLTAAGQFDYLVSKLNADEAETLAVGSPFDWENSALVYLASDMPDPAEAHAFQHSLESCLVSLCKATRGRALVLFTSYAQLRQTARAISGSLAQADIVVYEQGEGASPHALLESFRASKQAVLLGTRSFWEGVDVPGEALSVLVIVRLPFDVPTDPIVAARSETFEQPFAQFSLPEAILRFRQGFGRLIRTRTDRGVAVILDRRVRTKAYGHFFIQSLPPCTIREGSLATLPKVAAQWLGG